MKLLAALFVISTLGACGQLPNGPGEVRPAYYKTTTSDGVDRRITLWLEDKFTYAIHDHGVDFYFDGTIHDGHVIITEAVGVYDGWTGGDLRTATGCTFTELVLNCDQFPAPITFEMTTKE